MPDGLQGQAPPAAPVKPPQQAGLIAQSRLRVLIARKLLEAAVPILGTDSEDGKAVLGALSSLKRISGDTAPGLMQSEHRAMGAAVQPVPGPGPAGPMRGPMPAPGSMSAGAPAPMPMPVGGT